MDVFALINIAGRLSEYGFSANKTAALGLNLILLVNLAWSAFLQTGFLRSRRSLEAVERLADALPAGVCAVGRDRRCGVPAAVRIRLTFDAGQRLTAAFGTVAPWRRLMPRTPTALAQNAADAGSSDDPAGPSDSPSPPTSTMPPQRRTIFTWRRLIELIVELVAIYVLWPWLVAVYSSLGELSSLDPAWFAVMVALEIASFACLWVLIAIPLRSTRWFLIGTSQIVGYAVGLVLPGGNPAGTAAQIYLLANGGVDVPRATTGVMAAGLINLATLFALPVLALPAIFSGVTLNRGLEYALRISLLTFVALTVVFLVMLLAERPIEAIGRWVQQLRNCGCSQTSGTHGAS